MKIRLFTRAIVAIFLAVVCVSAQGGLQVDKSSIGGTVRNAASGKAEAGVYRPNPLAN